jgi:hypothetical protein
MNEEQTRINVSKAIETAYWYGMIDGIRDTYKMIFKTPKGTSKLNIALTETMDKILETANIDDKYARFILSELHDRDLNLNSLKQILWSDILLSLPELRNEIVFNKHMTEMEGKLKIELEEWKEEHGDREYDNGYRRGTGQ